MSMYCTLDIIPLTAFMGHLLLLSLSRDLDQAKLISLRNLASDILSKSIQALTVSRMILDFGVPKIPYATMSAVVLHRPAGFMAVHESVSRSKYKIVEPLMPLASCPQVAEE